MTDPRNNQPPLGQSLGDIVDHATRLVHEEIELAKTEVAISLKNLLRGSVASIVGGAFAFFGLFILLIGLSFLISDALGNYIWLGFLIVALAAFLIGGAAALFALRKIKKGSQLMPKQAIDEARKIQAAIKTEIEEPPVGQYDSVAVEEISGDIVSDPVAAAALAETAEAEGRQNPAEPQGLRDDQVSTASRDSGGPAEQDAARTPKPTFIQDKD
ncbi:MAG: phage holin family protein [Solirubrobacterales bacterium]